MTDPLAALTALITEHSGLTGARAGRLAGKIAAEWLPAQGVHVHHHDIERHAESYNEGYEAAVVQGLADDPTLAQDWLDAHDARVFDEAIRWARYNRDEHGRDVLDRDFNPYRKDARAAVDGGEHG